MTTEAEAITALALASESSKHKPFLMEAPEGRTLIVFPTDENQWAYEDITSPNQVEVLPPKIVTQSVNLQEVASIVEYINRFKNFDSTLFADIASNTIVAIVDYHKTPGANMPAGLTIEGAHNADAQHTKHRASLTLPFSLEWQTWGGIDGRLMSHVDFASFLEENQQDIMPLGRMLDRSGAPIEDAPTTLLELCRELQVRGSYGAASEIRNGDYASVEMQKGDDVSTKKNVSLPVSISLQIPVYFNEQAVMVTAFLRRKIDSGSLKLGIKLARPEQVRQQEFHRIVGWVATQVELTTLYGKPA